jgi:mono/diheme cytochrome c family protein
MSRLLRWAAVVVAGLGGLVLLAVASVYVASEVVLRRTYEVPLEAIAVPTDSASIAEGRRLATIRGCYDGCHGTGLDGTEFWDEPWIARLVAPNLTQVATRHSDAELERIIRDGVRPDGRSTWGMPSASFYHLSDADVGAMIAFIRSQPLSDGPATEVEVRLLARIGVLTGEFPPQAQVIDQDVPRLGDRPRSDTLAFGAYLARTTCSECHGLDLQGDPRGATPPLAIAAAYSREEFVRLMHTGVALGGRELGLMSDVSRRRFVHMTDDELNALHAFLGQDY